MTGIVISLSIAVGAASIGWLLAVMDAMEEARARRAAEDERDHYKKIVEAAERDVDESVDIEPFLRSLVASPLLTIVRGGR